jgi:hypothetical protein
MITDMIARQHQLRSLLVLVLRRQRQCSRRHAGLLPNHHQNTQNLVAQNRRCPFTLPVIPTLPAKIALAASRFITRAPEPAAKSP